MPAKQFAIIKNMENYERAALPTEQTIQGETSYFNRKFPPVGNWTSVVVREASPDSGEKGNARRFEIVANSGTAHEIFVCHYDEGDPERRTRAEDLLSEIYPIFSSTSPK